MEFRLLRVVEVFIATIGGALIGFTFGMTYLYNRTMDGLGLLEGGTPSHLDMETLYHVSRLMSDIIPVSKVQILAIAGLTIVSITILVALLVPTRKVSL